MTTTAVRVIRHQYLPGDGIQWLGVKPWACYVGRHALQHLGWPPWSSKQIKTTSNIMFWNVLFIILMYYSYLDSLHNLSLIYWGPIVGSPKGDTVGFYLFWPAQVFISVGYYVSVETVIWCHPTVNGMVQAKVGQTLVKTNILWVLLCLMVAIGSLFYLKCYLMLIKLLNNLMLY